MMNTNRKKFFKTIGTGLFGFLAFKMLPIKSLFTKSEKGKKIKVIINPDAVQRGNNGLKNG